MSIREDLDRCCPPDQDAGFCESWGCRTARQILDRTEAAEARVARLLDAYHASYRHGPDPDPKRCPACHAVAVED